MSGTSPESASKKWVAWFALLLSSVGLMAGSAGALAATITITANTNWSAILPVPSSADDVIVKNGATLTVNVADAVCQTLLLGDLNLPNRGSGTLSFNAASQVTVSGAVTLGNGSAPRNGSINMTNGGTLVLQGFVVNNLGTWTPGAGTVTLTATNTLPANFATYNNLTVSGAGMTTSLGASTTVNGALSVPSGTLALGAFTFQASGTTSVSGALNITSTTGTKTFVGLVTINPGGIWNNTANEVVTFQGGLTHNGATFNAGNGNQTIAGNLINTGTFNSGNGVWVFQGSAAQSLTGAVTFQNLTVNNASGLTLNNDATVAAVLTLTNGAVRTGTNKLIVSANCPGSISRTGGFVIGNLQLTFPGNTTVSCTYHVGSGTTYAPIGITMVTLILGGGTLTGSTIGSEHPQVDTSGIEAAKDVNRYWTLWATGDTLNASSYGATFNFGAGDLDISATPANFIVGKYAGGSWMLPTPVTATSTSTGISSVSGGIVGATDFAVGEALPVCAIPAGMPPGVTCVCDNFNRTSLNPSTVNGGSWFLSTSSGSFGLPRIANPGYLRLTDNSTGNTTSATVPGTFPAAGNFISVEFKHYAYNGNGADGIALTLSDAVIAPVAGAFGGSLGFAQKCQNGAQYNGATCVSDCTVAGGCPGFAGGWIGMAIDEYGNYSNNTEGRLGGPAPGLTPDSVAVRGSGSGMTGYPYLRGTGTLSPSIDNPGSISPAYGYAYRIVVDARSYTPGNKTTLVSLERDTSGTGNSYSSLVTSFDAFQLNPLQAVVPANWVLSFTGSTGASTNIHEIAGLKICAQTYVPPAGYRIQVDNLTPSTCTSQPSGKPIVTVAALDTNGNVITTYDKTVTLSALLAGGGASSAVWSKYSANGALAGNQYGFVPADLGVAKFYLTDSAQQDVYITISENGGTLASSLATPLKYRGGAFSVANTDALNANPGGGVVAGRPHLMSITRSNGCTTDTTYVGAKPLDGWYSPAAGDHPSGASAPQICVPNAGGACLPAAGASCLTLSISPPILSATSNNLPALTFGGGTAHFCLVTADVGKYSLSLRDDANISAPITGSSATLTARPFALAVSAIKQGATPNPGGSGNGGSRFVPAGDSFEATVGAYLWNSAVDANSDGVPDVGATLAGVVANGATTRYAWPTTLAAGAPYVPVAGTLGALGNASLSFVGGVANPTSLNYPEVGSFTLSAGASDFLNTAGLNLSGLIFNDAGSPVAGAVGRFYPHHFTISSTLTPACSSGNPFTYEGQPFNISFTLQAQNKNNAQTGNYGVAGYAPVMSGVLSLAAEDADAGQNWLSTGGGSRIVWTPPVLNWNNGVFASATIPLTFSRAASTDGPFNSWAPGLKLADNSGDNVPLLGDMNAATAGACAPCDAATLGGNGFSSKMLYGRLLVDNAYGTELLALPVNLSAQYWNGSAHVLNSDDSCTSIVSGNFSQAPGSGASISTSILGSGTLAGGIGKIKLTKPSPPPIGKGSVVLSANPASLGGYLPGSGLETFGVYKSRLIYMREMY